jgi:hypothetical protein
MANELQETLTNDHAEQVALSAEETVELLSLSQEAIDEELKLIEQRDTFDRLMNNDDFMKFIDLYCKDEPERITSVITSTENVSAQNIKTLQEMLLSIRYFKIFIESKEAEGNGAEIRLKDHVEYREKLENGQILKYKTTEEG